LIFWFFWIKPCVHDKRGINEIGTELSPSVD
jgi:hypothetical protein